MLQAFNDLGLQIYPCAGYDPSVLSRKIPELLPLKSAYIYLEMYTRTEKDTGSAFYVSFALFNTVLNFISLSLVVREN